MKTCLYLSVAVSLSTALLSCTDSQPCSDCPPMEGTWFFQYLAPDFPCDAGVLADPPATVSFTREGSVMRSAIDGIQLSGTLYDTFEFSLNGQMPGGGLTISMRGSYKPSTRSDAGDETLYSGRLARSTDRCRDDRRFTGARY